MTALKDYTKAQVIQRIIEQMPLESFDFLYSQDATTGAPLPPTAEEVTAFLRDQDRRYLIRLFVPLLTEQELADLDEVRSNRLVRPHRADRLSAALGEPTEIERERAAVKTTKDLNAVAPSQEDAAKLYTPIQVQSVLSDDGSFVEDIKIQQWVQDPETGQPVLVQMTDLREAQQ